MHNAASGKRVVETGYATTVGPRGLSVLVPRFGIETFVFLDAPPHGSEEAPLQWCAEKQQLSTDVRLGEAAACTIRALDKVAVSIGVDTSRLHPRLAMELLDEATGEPLLDVLGRRAKEVSAEQASASGVATG